ncbi:MAG: MarR family transcriptional regulator [Devosia sp.]
MKRRFEEEARAHGVTLPQWRALSQIAFADSISQVALAQAMDADQMTVSGVLDRLEKRGLITREADPADSRAKLARVTDKGLAVVKMARAAGTAMYEAALVGVPSDDAAIATRVLQQMRENLLGQTADAKEQ